MSDLLNMIHDNVKEIKKDVKEQNERLCKIEILDAVQNEQLAEHMRRTHLAEKRITKLETLKWMIVGAGAIAAVVGKFLGVY